MVDVKKNIVKPIKTNMSNIISMPSKNIINNKVGALGSPQ